LDSSLSVESNESPIQSLELGPPIIFIKQCTKDLADEFITTDLELVPLIFVCSAFHNDGL
jgi:hypothetical protein